MSNVPAPSSLRSKILHFDALPDSSTRTPLQPRLLLVEPEFDLPANGGLSLAASRCAVTIVSRHSNVFKLHPDAGFSVAVLNDALGLPALRSVATYVRRTWPAAQILMLRRVESALEAHLYDETIDYAFRPNTPLDAPVSPADARRPRKSPLAGTNPDTPKNSGAPLPSSPSSPRESDPTKAHPRGSDAEKTYSREIPGKEQGGERA
jgi:hypothetical protein